LAKGEALASRQGNKKQNDQSEDLVHRLGMVAAANRPRPQPKWSTATSPSKRSKTKSRADSDNSVPTHGKTKGPFVKYMKAVQTKLDKEAEKFDSILQALVNQGNEKARRSEERAKSVAKCQNLAVECGATEESIEYFVACDLFK
jgi:hypothetical protein